ncbi:hypothetical protein ABIB87_006882, partial [Bradyrhizobium sp. JR18.2]
RIVGNMEAAPAHHAFKIDVKHQSNGPQSYAYVRRISDRDYTLAIRSRMPLCKNCQHSGLHHHWRIARLRGRCRHRGCCCVGYVPDVDRPKPLNKVIGWVLYERRENRGSLRPARIEHIENTDDVCFLDHAFCLIHPILLFDWDHPSVPTCTRRLPSRTAAVKDEPPFAATASAARGVLDGREHGGMLGRVGCSPSAGGTYSADANGTAQLPSTPKRRAARPRTKEGDHQYRREGIASHRAPDHCCALSC